jgi:hypothetical protein
MTKEFTKDCQKKNYKMKLVLIKVFNKGEK